MPGCAAFPRTLPATSNLQLVELSIEEDGRDVVLAKKAYPGVLEGARELRRLTEGQVPPSGRSWAREGLVGESWRIMGEG